MDYSKKWKIIGNLGEGGQGKVYRVLKLDVEPNNKQPIISALKKIVLEATNQQIREENYETFYKVLLEMFKERDLSKQGALKVLHKPQEARNAVLAQKRIKREINAMFDNLHPNLIKILDADPESSWYVSQFYPNGTLLG